MSSAHSDEKYATQDWVDENSALPPYTHEEPGLNVTDLEARIRREMEEKIRREMEEKVRVEMEAKMREEMEAKRALDVMVKEQEAKRALEAMIEERYKKVVEVFRQRNHPSSQPSREFITFVEKKRVIYIVGEDQICDYSAKPFKCDLYLLITPNEVGIVRWVGKGPYYTDGLLEWFPLYTFDHELTQRDLVLLDQMRSSQHYSDAGIYKKTTHPIAGEYLLILHQDEIPFKLFVPQHNYGGAPPKYHYRGLLESVIRLIPGSYNNGPWRPLDGFFGLYVNKDTLEIYPHAPPAME